MDVHLQRVEIRRQMRAMLGQTTDESLAAQTAEQYNAFIGAATVKAMADARWYALERRADISLGVEQYKVPYPSGCTPGGVRSAALWDPGVSAYIPMTRKRIPLADDVEQQEAAGGSTFQAVQGTPRSFEPRGDFIYLWPVNDSTTGRMIRLEYYVSTAMTADSDLSPVDGMLILYFATSMACGAMADREREQQFMALYADRLAQLRGWHATGERLAMLNSGAYDDGGASASNLPNWDRSPAVRP
jgi:hypothetical protein